MFRNRIAAIAAPVILACCASTAQAKSEDKLGKGDYFVFYLPGHPMTQSQFDILQPLDAACRDQAKRQTPSVLKTVLLVAIRNAPGAVLGTGAGAALGGFTPKGGSVTAVDYGLYGGVSTIGGSIGAGINAYEMGKHATIAGCMMSMVVAYRLFTDGDKLRNLIFAYNTFPVNGHPIKRSELPEGVSDDTPRMTRVKEEDSATTPPPPAR